METQKQISRKALFGFAGAGVVAVAVIAFVAGLMVARSGSAIPRINQTEEHVAIKGYDTVAYFTEGAATKGSEKFEARWEDARWRFASAGNRDLFEANPERYAPQYGGYCAGGVAVGEFADADPEAWKIVDGKLYFIHSKEYFKVWDKAPEAHIDYAEYNWSQNRENLRNNL